MLKQLQILYIKLKSFISKHTTYYMIDTPNNTVITFKNGSMIKTIKNTTNDVVRSKRAEIYDWSDTNDYPKEQLDKILSKYIKQ